MPRWTQADLKIEVLHPSTSAVLLDVSGIGDLSIDGLEADDRTTVSVRERLDFIGRVRGAQNAQEISLTINLPNAELSDPSVYKAHDWVRHRGAFAAIATSDPGGREWATKLKVTLDDGATVTGWTFNAFRPRGGVQEGEVLALAVSGQNEGGYTEH